MTPNDQRRPARGGVVMVGETNDDSLRRPHLRPHDPRLACPHGRTRYCRKCRFVARRDAAVLKGLCRREEDKVPPSTYALSDEDLRRHANHLHDEGWAVEEITSVVEVSPR